MTSVTRVVAPSIAHLPTPSWAHGKDYDKALIWDIEDLIERQKRKATAENLRQKLLKSQKIEAPRSRHSTSTADNTCQRKNYTSSSRVDIADSREHGTHHILQDTGSNQDTLSTNAHLKSHTNIPAHAPSHSASQQSHCSPPAQHRTPSHLALHSTQLPQFATPNPSPPRSEPSMTCSPTPPPPCPAPVKPPPELSVVSGGRIKKKARRPKSGRVPKMVRAWRRDVVVNGEGGGREGGDGVWVAW